MPDTAHIQRGSFIVLEGIDGSGTTTQAQLLVDWLNAQRIAACLTHEPSDGHLGQHLRQILGRRERPVNSASLALLFASDRLDHVQERIEPLLCHGTHVVSDRYVYSSVAYQGLDLDLDWVGAINARAPEAALTIYLRVAPEVAGQRRRIRGGQSEVFETDNVQKRVAANYDRLFGTDCEAGTWHVDARDGHWYCGQARGKSKALETLQRQPSWAVIDGGGSKDAIHTQIRMLVQTVLCGA